MNSRIKEILDNSNLMFLGTEDHSGPWVAPVCFLHDDTFNLYWQSNIDSRHSKAVLENKKVSGAIVLHDGFYGNKPELALQFEGLVEKIDGENKVLSNKHFVKRKYKERNKPIPDNLNALWLNYSWYKLTPTFVELIDEENFSHDKQKIIFNKIEMPPFDGISRTTFVEHINSIASGGKKSIEKEYKFTDFTQAMDFANKVAKIAEEMQHHPEIEIKYNVVEIETTTHDAGNMVTEKDIDLMKQIDKIYQNYKN